MKTFIKFGQENPTVYVPQEHIDKLKAHWNTNNTVFWGPYLNVQYIAENLEELKLITEYNNSLKKDTN